jgi:cell division protein ZapE
MSPLERYQQDLQTGHILPDATQAQAIQALQHIYEQLIQRQQQQRTFMYRLRSHMKRPQSIKGLYMWGGVGIGKTYLMDTFFKSLPNTGKFRMHFHAFMQMVHQQLRELQGQENPLQLIAKNLSNQATVLCFDEFFVSDIGDAMLLAGLLEALFAYGMTLITTSNVEPTQLYYNGLQRSRFLPAIDLIQQYTDVIHLDIQHDYRLRHLTQFGGYYWPLDIKAEENMLRFFHHLSHGATPQIGNIQINERDIAYKAHAGDVIWFDFEHLCNIPRSPMDYLELAKRFQTVLVSNVPQLAQDQTDKVTYFINLVDVFYDSHVKLIISAAVPIADIYTAGRLVFEYQRTQSRLQEMQSKEYWHLPHQVSVVE